MKPSIRNLQTIRQQNPKLGEALDDVIASFDNTTQSTVTSPSGTQVSPPPVSAIQVAAQDGIFHATLTDNAPIYRGINYYLEYDTDPNFSQPHVIDNGSSRTYRGYLGNIGLHWRGYSQYPSGGPPSTPIVHGGQRPILVQGGGTATGPALFPSTGSGTAASNGTQGGSGAGRVIARVVNGKLPTL